MPCQPGTREENWSSALWCHEPYSRSQHPLVFGSLTNPQSAYLGRVDNNFDAVQVAASSRNAHCPYGASRPDISNKVEFGIGLQSVFPMAVVVTEYGQLEDRGVGRECYHVDVACRGRLTAPRSDDAGDLSPAVVHWVPPRSTPYSFRTLLMVCRELLPVQMRAAMLYPAWVPPWTATTQ